MNEASGSTSNHIMNIPDLSHIEEFSAIKLHSVRLKLGILRDEVTTTLIEEGRGHERTSEIIQKDDALSKWFKEIVTAWEILRAEEDARNRWHGCLKPIKRVL